MRRHAGELREGEPSVGFTEVDGLNDVRVLDLADGLGLSMKSSQAHEDFDSVSRNKPRLSAI